MKIRKALLGHLVLYYGCVQYGRLKLQGDLKKKQMGKCQFDLTRVWGDILARWGKRIVAYERVVAVSDIVRG